MDLIDEIMSAFSGRVRPKSVVPDGAPSTNEYAEAQEFLLIDSNCIDCDFLQTNSDCVYGFNPEAFVFFLPKIYIATINENNPRVAVVDSIIAMLDRGDQSAAWGDFFMSRWCLLNEAECVASQEWVLWLAGAGYPEAFGDELSRAYDTLSLLSSRARSTI